MKEIEFIKEFKNTYGGFIDKSKSFDIYPAPKESNPFRVINNGVELGCLYLHFDRDMEPPIVWVMYLKSYEVGNGSQILKLLCDFADNKEVTLYLEPSPDKGSRLNCPELVAWYRRHAFIGEATMERKPNA